MKPITPVIAGNNGADPVVRVIEVVKSFRWAMAR